MQILGNFYASYLTFLGLPNQVYPYDLNIRGYLHETGTNLYQYQISAAIYSEHVHETDTKLKDSWSWSHDAIIGKN